MTQPTTPVDEVTALARRYAVEINTGTAAAPEWARLFGVAEFKPVMELRTESDEDYEDDGAEREAVTGHNSRMEIKLKHRVGPDGQWNPVQEFLEEKFRAAASGVVNGQFGARYFDRAGRGQAVQGTVYVKEWSPDGGGGDALDNISVVLQFQGKTSLVANPVADAGLTGFAFTQGAEDVPSEDTD